LVSSLLCAGDPVVLQYIPTRLSSDLLDPNYKDIFGDPLLRVTNKITDHDVRIAKFGAEKMGELMKEMGADIVETVIADKWSHEQDRKSTRLNSSHVSISYAVFCLNKK